MDWDSSGDILLTVFWQAMQEQDSSPLIAGFKEVWSKICSLRDVSNSTETMCAVTRDLLLSGAVEMHWLRYGEAVRKMLERKRGLIPNRCLCS